jgi:biopolymer transport protein ExbD
VKFRRRRQEEPGVNLTPLIDVVFLLLIFFMVSTTFTRETRLVVDLPEADSQAAEPSPQQVEILVNGTALFDREVRTIQAALYEVTEGDTTQPLLISADAQAAHAAVVRAMDAAGQMGFSRLRIASLRPASTAP